jgi:hypothetical protein
MVTFEVHGPFEISFEIRANGRFLLFDDFWKDDSPAAYLADERGCYVFAMRTGGGLQPIYVGKAAKTTFRYETFNPSNRYKYHNGFSEYTIGTPLMFFVIRSTRKGRLGPSLIKEIEDFLIQAGAAKNPRLQNVIGRQQPRWRISGVIRSGVGKKSQTARVFRDLFDIHD